MEVTSALHPVVSSKLGSSCLSPMAMEAVTSTLDPGPVVPSKLGSSSLSPMAMDQAVTSTLHPGPVVPSKLGSSSLSPMAMEALHPVPVVPSKPGISSLSPMAMEALPPVVPSKLGSSSLSPMAMEVQILSSKLVKPTSTILTAEAEAKYMELSVFDKVTYQIQMAIIYAFAPPTPTSVALEKGLAAALSVHRALAGQLVIRDNAPVVLLNDRGARVVEARVDANLVDVAPAVPRPELLQLHPCLEDQGLEEIVVLQLTRFRCGSLAIWFTANHAVTDGRGTSSFLVAWGRATRELDMGIPPVYYQEGLFQPRSPPSIVFDHSNREYYLPPATVDDYVKVKEDSTIVVHKVHLSKDFISRIRATASQGRDRPFSRFQTILAHLWRAITQARGLPQKETTTIRISVDGRERLGVPAEYGGNLVLWAFPRAKVCDLLRQPIRHAVQVIHEEVASVADEAYFKSFVDFAKSGTVEDKALAPTAALNLRDVLCPDLEVHSWLTFPFYDIDFGTGTPTYVMPSYLPVEGLIFLMPSYMGDGSVDAFVPVFKHNLEAFKKCCYSSDMDG